MIDFKFDWDPILTLNIPQLDAHHQHFFKLGRDIEQFLLIQCVGVTNEDLLKLLYDLRDYITYHFYEEEKVMEEINFPELEEHKLQHQIFLHYINHIDYDKLCDNPYTELQNLKDYLVSWSFTHIIQQDQKLTHYYQLACNN